MWTLQQVDDLELHKEDLIAILAGRYGLVPDSVYGYIERLSDTDTVDHLIAVAASSHTWTDFVRVLKQEVHRVKQVAARNNSLIVQ